MRDLETDESMVEQGMNRGTVNGEKWTVNKPA
jgi:hypothetical protein